VKCPEQAQRYAVTLKGLCVVCLQMGRDFELARQLRLRWMERRRHIAPHQVASPEFELNALSVCAVREWQQQQLQAGCVHCHSY
jgi:hypothetical protein